MRDHLFDYQRHELDAPPGEEALQAWSTDGWRLVSVVEHEGRFVAYLERPAEGPHQPHGPTVFETFHQRMAEVLRTHRQRPELQRLADGIGNLHEAFLELLREQLGEAELERLAAEDPALAAALAEVRARPHP